jgi:hypothetical protein
MLGYSKQVIWGDTVATRAIEYRGGAERLINFADRFGPFYRAIELGIRYFMIGAIINGKRYGSLVVSNAEKGDAPPSDFVVTESFPNPFNSSVTIQYQIPTAGEVEGRIYNILGMRVKTIVPSQQQQAGKYSVHWDGKNDHGSDVSSGVYFIRIRWNDRMKTVRSVYLK